MAIHDLNLASRYADTLVMLKKGRIYATGDPVSLLASGNVRSVYGVEVVVMDNFETAYVMPVRSLN